MSRLRMELAVAALAALGFLSVFVLSAYGWSRTVVSGALYANVFMVAFLGGWLGLGARKLNVWQSIVLGSGAVLFVLLAWR